MFSYFSIFSSHLKKASLDYFVDIKKNKDIDPEPFAAVEQKPHKNMESEGYLSSTQCHLSIGCFTQLSKFSQDGHKFICQCWIPATQLVLDKVCA